MANPNSPYSQIAALVVKVVLLLMLALAAQATPDGKLHQGWLTHREPAENIEFSCPRDWVYEGAGPLGAYRLSGPDGRSEGGVFAVAITVSPADTASVGKLMVALTNADEEASSPLGSHPQLLHSGWLDAATGMMFEKTYHGSFPWDDSKFLKTVRYIALADRVVTVVADVAEPVSSDQLDLLHAVLDSFRLTPSLYDQLRLDR